MVIKEVTYARIYCDQPGCDGHTQNFENTESERIRNINFAVDCLGWTARPDGKTFCPSHSPATQTDEAKL